MALRVVRTKVEWCKTFQDIGIPNTELQQYAECFETNGLSEVDIPELDKDTLRELPNSAISWLSFDSPKSNQPSEGYYKTKWLPT